MNTILADTVTRFPKITELLDSFIEIYFGDTLKLGHLKETNRKFQEDLIKKQLYQGINTIDEENFQSPFGLDQEVIFSTALNQYATCFTSEHYQKLFSKLISSTFDKSKYGYLHPSFSFIIPQLTPLDCKILLDINSCNVARTIWIYFSYEKDSGDTCAESFSQVYAFRNENGELEDIELTNISINNLVKQGLMQLKPVNESIHSCVLDYDLKELLKSIGIEDLKNGGAAGAASDFVTLTRLGKSFIATCT